MHRSLPSGATSLALLVSSSLALAQPAPEQGNSNSNSDSEVSWFARAPVALTLGQGDRQLTITLYGILQADFIYDTTRSYPENISSNLVARSDTYEGTVGRTQASTRNSRVGLSFLSTPTAGVTPSAVIEGDFRGNQPDDPPDLSENAYYGSPTFRIRHAYVKLQSDVVDFLAGQTYDLFARQDTFDPGSRNPQLRLSHEFGARAPVSFDIAAAAVRPVQRDARLPDAHAALRLDVNSWKGIGTPRGVPSARPLSLGVSAVARQFDVDAFTPPPTQRSNKVVGWGLAVDALLPVIPAQDEFDRGNKLTLMGQFVTGTGIADLVGANGGAEFTPLPNPARANPPPIYQGNVDEGLLSFDVLGVLNTIDWQAFRVGAEYYLPPIGRVMVSAHYMEALSDNMSELYPRGGAEIELLTHVADRIRLLDLDAFWNVTPQVRLGLGGAYSEVEYLDGERPHNVRGRALANYYF